MPTRITLSSDLFHDGTVQEVSVRDHLPLHKLVEEIKLRYNLPEAHYMLTVGDNDTSLDVKLTLETAGVKTGTILRFGLAQSLGKDYVSSGKRRAFLTASDGRTFEIVRQPALIGRPNPARQIVASMLDVDLTSLDPQNSSSRPHARIIEREGQHYVESLRDDNLTYVNERAVLPGSSCPLQSGDKLRFGSVTLEFRLADK